jgi:CRISPR-associated endonuclease Csn1
VILAPRGALSEETVYGRIKVPEKRILKLSPGLNLEDVPKIVPKRIRQMVEKRLEENGGDPAKAFKGYAKHPILYLEGSEEKALMVVEVADYRDAYVVKYGLDGNFKEKDADSIIDGAVKKVVKERLAQFGGDPKKAFADLENNPIWLNREKGVQVKRVRCDAGLKKVATARKNEDGEPISFVVPGNNHHVAIYRDADGKLHESTVTFLEAVQRKQLGLPVVVHQPASVWDMLLAKAQHSLSEETWASLEASLPKPEWEFVLSMNINEMFVFNMSREELEEAIARNDHAAISPNLYRVQKLSEKDYYFRQHRETKVDDKFGENKDEKLAMVLGKVIRIRSCSGMEQAIKVKISRLGQIEIT